MTDELFGLEASGESTEGTMPAAVQSYAASLAVIELATLIGLWVAPRWGTAPIALMYLLAVLCAAALWGIPRGLIAGIVSALAYDFFFAQPLHTLRIDRAADIVTVATLLILALVTTQLGGRIGTQARIAASVAARNETMARFTGRLLSCSTEQEVVWAACAELHRLFHCNVILVAGIPEPRIVGSIPEGLRLTPTDVAAAALTIHSGEPAGRGTYRLQTAEWFFQPVPSIDIVNAAVGLARDDGKPPIDRTQLPLMANLVEKVALALRSRGKRLTVANDPRQVV